MKPVSYTHLLIVVTLNCPDDWNTHIALYERAFAELKAQTPAVTLPATSIPVTGGESAEVPLELGGTPPHMALFQGEESRLTMDIQLPRFIYAPISAGTQVGKVTYYLDNLPMGEQPLIAAQDVTERQPPQKKPSWWEKVQTFFKNLF